MQCWLCQGGGPHCLGFCSTIDLLFRCSTSFETKNPPMMSLALHASASGAAMLLMSRTGSSVTHTHTACMVQYTKKVAGWSLTCEATTHQPHIKGNCSRKCKVRPEHLLDLVQHLRTPKVRHEHSEKNVRVPDVCQRACEFRNVLMFGEGQCSYERRQSWPSA